MWWGVARGRKVLAAVNDQKYTHWSNWFSYKVFLSQNTFDHEKVCWQNFCATTLIWSIVSGGEKVGASRSQSTTSELWHKSCGHRLFNLISSCVSHCDVIH